MSAIHERIAALNLAPLWQHSSDLLPFAPTSSATAECWRYRDVRAALDDASEVMSAEDSDRRVLLLLNPGLDGVVATTTSLLAGVQMLLPGESARAHRHTTAVVRFIISGEGAYTVTDGERVPLEPGDVVITPSWAWHDHSSDSQEPVVWLDGLDLPLVRSLEVGCFELYPRERQPVRAAATSSARHPWPRMRDALESLPAAGMATLDYVDPSSGGPVTPTLGCRAHRIGPGQTGRRPRETASTVFHVVAGEGASVVGDVEVSWAEGDIFVVPGWTPAHHVNQGTEAAFLFSITDEPALRALGLYRSTDA